VAENWLAVDGSEEEFTLFCIDNLLDNNEVVNDFTQISQNMVNLRGYTSKIRFGFTESERFTDVNELKADRYFRKSVPSVDLYTTKLAQFIQLNYPYFTLEEKRELGKEWSREKWAMVALGGDFSIRNSDGFEREAADESAAFQKYMQHYFLRMDHLLDKEGSTIFPKGSLLHSHRGLRDNTKEEYARTGGYQRQVITGVVIEHILQGTVPKLFLEDSTTFWNPYTNELYHIESDVRSIVNSDPEGPVRYEGFRSMFLNRSSADILYPEGSTVITRNFENQNLQITEVEKIIRDFLSDPLIAETGKLIEERLGRPLEPFDIWYSGFQEQLQYSPDLLDSITMARYPDPASLQNGLPEILINMGFSEEEARFIGNNTSVRSVVSGGYTDSPSMEGEKAIMTTMFGADGLDYKSYRVAMHELGHVVCALFSLDEADNFLLAGVPSNGITEAMAELLAYKNIDGLGLKGSVDLEQQHLLALSALWYLVEMGGQALTDIETWKWIYANPDAGESEVQKAILSITGEIWNTYFSEVFNGSRDQHILSIYNHFITGSLYLYNYFLGNVIMYQLSDAYRGGDLATSLRLACREGNTLPELWMERAVGEGISTKALLVASKEAVKYFKGF
jgi:hypothetical protein